MQSKATRYFLIFLTFILSGGVGLAQKGYFPDKGDTIYFLVDRMPDHVRISDQGRFAQWDVSMAKAPFLRPVVVVDPGQTSSGKYFSESNFALNNYDQTVEYYKMEGEELYILGKYGFFIHDQFVPALVRYDYPILINAPDHGMQKTWEYSANAEVTFSSSVLQPSFRNLLPVAADSIRVKFKVIRKTRKDGEGELKYQILYDEVSRYFTIEEYDYSFFLKVPGKTWQNFTHYVDLKKLFGSSNRYMYDFRSNESGLPVAHVEVEPTTREALLVKYWMRSYLDRFQKAGELTEPDIFAFPNPAIGFVNIELNNLKPGSYRVVLYNFLAQEVFRMPVRIVANETVQIDVSAFEKGPYLYALVDSYGRRVKTKRLTILQP